ncbi:MAG: carbohydrate binding family 9 domain-containing protein [Gemmatimonadetes bacterium]|nr:carbohydrate binding family 9 domain-containing protein [Gemmatimonadota bacterium]
MRRKRSAVGVAHIAVFSLAATMLPLRLGAQMVSVTGSAPSARQVAIRRLAQRATIDGRLDEPAWRDAALLDGFTQREPNNGAPASERTEIRMYTDAEALYVGAWLFDSHAVGIVPGEKVRDGLLTNSDAVTLVFDTYHDRQNGFVFATTPAGIEYDGQVTREGEGGGVFQQGQTRAQTGAIGGFNLNWDGSWAVATSRDSLGWYAEFRIPFTTLRYAGGASQSWGLNVSRLIRRTNEEVFWSNIPRQFNIYRLSLAGTITGIDAPTNRIATVTPYVIGSTRKDHVPKRLTTTEQDVGVDAKYGLTPSLTLDLTYNTDFAQVEVDDQRVNLTRFPLFFPEKRPFFLENAGVFSAGTPQAVELFFTRRIGIDSLGNPLPLLGGGRITGRVGGTTVGGLQMLTNDFATLRGQSYSVGRASREFGRRSRLGLIGVQRMARENTDDVHRTVGVDGRLGMGNDWTVDWWGATTDSPNRGNDDAGYSGRVSYQTEKWNNNIRFLQVGTDFVPELGFLNRTGGYRHVEIGGMRYVRDKGKEWLRVWNPHFTYRGYWNIDGYFQSGWLHLDLTEVEFSNGGRFGPEFNIYQEGLRRPFTIAPGITLPAGGYYFPELGLDWQTDPSRALSFVTRTEAGPFYNGSRVTATSTLTARRGATFSSSLLVDYSDVHLAQGDFSRSLIALRLAYFFTPRISLQTLTQFNDQARVWTANARLSWLNTAGTGLFVVFNDAEDATGFFAWQRPMTRAFTVKFTRQFGTGG